MKKLLLLGVAVLGMVSCQKDYIEGLESDLDYQLHANAELQKQINLLHQDLADQISKNEAKALELIALEDEITALTTELGETVTALGLSDATIEDLKDKLLQLEALVISTNAQIEALLDELGIALLQTEQDEDLIADLVQQITILENKEPEIIIEYVEVINTVTEYVTQYVTEYIELPPNLTTFGLPDYYTAGFAWFTDKIVDVSAGDTVLAVDWVTGETETLTVDFVTPSNTGVRMDFTTDILNVSTSVVLFKVTH